MQLPITVALVEFTYYVNTVSNQKLNLILRDDYLNKMLPFMKMRCELMKYKEEGRKVPIKNVMLQRSVDNNFV